ncbi:histone H1.8 isoform X2 [Microcaecilia unicolor]|uniref:Protein B4 isoform X2 n=1 Tax=Microcaecilia unicolor TaxID=1415580 RepID=A0A6P7YIL4_9AMPH|nr:protein B4 isoform X2 [Microcaecilia unicolor]
MPPKKATAVLEKPLNSGEVDGDVKSKVAKTTYIGHPPTLTMVVEALKKYNDKKGTSVQAIRAHILAAHPSVDPLRLTSMLRKAFAKGVETGVLGRPANSSALGVTGRFKLITKKTGVMTKTSEDMDPTAEQDPKAVKEVYSKPKSKATGERTKPIGKAKASGQDKSKAAGNKAKKPVKVKTSAKKVTVKVPNEMGTKGVAKSKSTQKQAEETGTSEKPAPARRNGGNVNASARNTTKQVKKK